LGKKKGVWPQVFISALSHNATCLLIFGGAAICFITFQASYNALLIALPRWMKLGFCLLSITTFVIGNGTVALPLATHDQLLLNGVFFFWSSFAMVLLAVFLTRGAQQLREVVATISPSSSSLPSLSRSPTPRSRHNLTPVITSLLVVPPTSNTSLNLHLSYGGTSSQVKSAIAGASIANSFLVEGLKRLNYMEQVSMVLVSLFVTIQCYYGATMAVPSNSNPEEQATVVYVATSLLSWQHLLSAWVILKYAWLPLYHLPWWPYVPKHVEEMRQAQIQFYRMSKSLQRIRTDSSQSRTHSRHGSSSPHGVRELDPSPRLESLECSLHHIQGATRMMESHSNLNLAVSINESSVNEPEQEANANPPKLKSNSTHEMNSIVESGNLEEEMILAAVVAHFEPKENK
jgi:hypothetical protein